jgi:DNA invertase Pin-like site-specific DNA recombinase
MKNRNQHRTIEGRRVVGVARQSRGDDGSMSVPDQIERMRDECERGGAELVEVYTEQDVSGRRPLERRDGLRQAVADVEAGRADLIMAAYFDRFVRSVKVKDEVLDRVEAKGGHVVTLDFGAVSNGTAMGWLSSTQHAAFAEYFARVTAERTAESKQRNIDKGVPPFPRITPAYRRRADGTLEPHPKNAPIIREAIRMRLDNDASYTTLARFLAERGIRMTPGGVKAMLTSRLMIGELHFGNFRPNLTAIDEPIMDGVTFRRVQTISAPRGRYAKSERLLARLGILRCATCNARLSVDTARRGRGAARKLYSYYRCGNRLCSGPAVVSCDVADAVLRDEAIRLSAEVEGRASAEAELEVARLRREAAESKLANAIRTLSGLGGEATTKEVLDELQAERDEAVDEHERLASLTTPDVTLRTTDDWDRLTFDEKRDVIRAVIARAVVRPGRGSDRITVEGR